MKTQDVLRDASATDCIENAASNAFANGLDGPANCRALRDEAAIHGDTLTAQAVDHLGVEAADAVWNAVIKRAKEGLAKLDKGSAIS